MDYAIARQRDRRNLTTQERQAGIARYVQLQDRVNGHGGDRRSDEFKAPFVALNGKSATETADVLGVAARTIQRTRAVLASEDEDTKAQLLNGNMAPSAAFTQVKRTEAARAEVVRPHGARGYVPLHRAVGWRRDKDCLDEVTGDGCPSCRG